ncbi:hypothetical protein PVS71_02835 [Pediococcus acidilactici]|uniref:oligosaccharide flippase family protein n=1 Tax=Pediococcus acidilactici TaxID=1254 RepID=UPI00237EFC3C|nr:oligosaccharide flippase family protein [Pediococcus acidilactici]WDV25784.1 hypothetical protein PVS71_02835 [Pediococcus acidilactici]WEE14849.1 hypothetical protein PX336_02835 [Pediococcus acidilactici]
MDIRQIVKNFSYTISSNLLSLLVSTLVILVVPKLIGVDEYGYWQLYLFYTTYVGIFHLGWFDGIYLRYGGVNYKDIDKGLFNSQFFMSFILEMCFAFAIFLVGFLNYDPNQGYIIIMTGIAMVFMNMGQFFMYILQITNQINRYSMFNVINRLVYLVFIVVALAIGVRDYKVLVLADLTGRFTALVYGMVCCKDIVFRPLSKFYFSFKEAVNNINVGIKLLIANFASNLVVGVIRYGIKFQGGVAVFGKLSLTLSVSNLLMTFIGAISLVLFPTLKRIKTNLDVVYRNIRVLLLSTLIFGLFLYFPIMYLLPIWLPKYSDSLAYMAVLFPMCLFDGKFEILINTFMKSLRIERTLLFLNIFSVLLSGVLTVINIFVIGSVTLMMFSIILVLAIRSTVGEVIVCRMLNIFPYKQMFIEILVVLIFVLATWYLNILLALVIYTIVFIVYVYFHLSSIKNAITYFKNMDM